MAREQRAAHTRPTDGRRAQHTPTGVLLGPEGPTLWALHPAMGLRRHTPPRTPPVLWACRHRLLPSLEAASDHAPGHAVIFEGGRECTSPCVGRHRGRDRQLLMRRELPRAV